MVNLLLVKFHLPQNIILFYRHFSRFTTSYSSIKGNAALPDKLKGYIQKWPTMGESVKQQKI